MGASLVDALWRWLFDQEMKKLPTGQLTIEGLEDKLVRAFEDVYEPGQFNQPDEFVLLAELLRVY